MRFLLSNKYLNDKLKNLSASFDLKKLGPLDLIIDEVEFYKEGESNIYINQGYLRNFEAFNERVNVQEEQAIDSIFASWPVKENITGSFSSFIFDKKKSEVVLCNDPIGVYPLYYLKSEEGFFVSNSIILLGNFTDVKFDETGIIQRTTLPEYSSIGSRTILENCKRILPGEWIRFNYEGDILDTKYDNSLFNSTLTGDTTNLVNDYWKLFKEELDILLKEEKELSVALSGGIDSRILLGALPEKKDIKCISYGPNDSYEISVARKLAKRTNADYKNYSDTLINFPNLELIEEYVSKTEGVYLCSWLEILENIRVEKKDVLLIGDLSTALTGRTIKRFSSKEYQRKNFVRHSLFSRDYKFEENSKENFENWKKRTVDHYLSFYSSKTIKARELKISKSSLAKNIENDLNELFQRIESHKLKYIELVDELFLWYTHTRIPMGKQILINNYKYRSYCPGMSMRVLRYTSSIHPNERLNHKFINNLGKQIPILKDLGGIPTSQIPLIAQNAPSILRFPIWALRSKIDNILIKRLVKAKSPKGRYRLFLGHNWVEIYQNPNLEKNVGDYFENGHLGFDYMEQVKLKAFERKNLKRWPFANMDIINAAALNLEIDQIKNKKL
ncbi:asparagine synthetase B (glutamine-hydrolysing) [Gramella sp. Hel_I_59]|uniref:asparagine synthase-related protein n=1 Tax=Gramella sp. Hel_I_59 TaxID=1249978 RepID=UPI00115310BE|nr:asparagine synthase-related protein [Gramella sp. Hel_I_59]TQI71522.1 asparagine synthetase B (glutamine-hydrolysing) [Gramella sp. Hel_I_59]